MKKWYFLFFILMPAKYIIAGAPHLYRPGMDTIINKGKIDTSSKIEDKVIDAVIESKLPVNK